MSSHLTRTALLVLCCCAACHPRPDTGRAPPTGGEVGTGDGLALTLDGSGRVISVELYDHELVSAPQPLVEARVRLLEQREDNLLESGQLEDGSSPWGEVDGWVDLDNPDDPPLVFSAVPKVCSELPGEHALGMEVASTVDGTATHFDGVASAFVDVVPGADYRVSAWVQASRGYLGGAYSGNWQSSMLDRWEQNRDSMGIRVLWADAQESPLVDEATNAAITGINAYGCKRIGGLVTAPAGATRARLELWGRLSELHSDDGGVEAVVFDEVVFAPSPDTTHAGTGEIDSTPDGLRGDLSFAGADLHIEDLTLVGGAGRIRIEGTLHDDLGEERAIELSVGLPTDVADFMFYAEPDVGQPTDAALLRERTISASSRAPMFVSLYPLVVVDHASKGAIAIHQPRDRVQFARLRHHGPRGRLEAVFLLGLSPAAVSQPSSARFAIDLMSSPATLGWRGAWDKAHQVYEAEHPEWYRSIHNDMEGYGDFEQGRYMAGVDEALEHDEQDPPTYSAHYVHMPVFDVPLTGPSGWADQAPDYLGVLDKIAEFQDCSSCEDWFRSYYDTAEHSLAHDLNGDVVFQNIELVGGQFSANVLSDVDPEIEGGTGQWYLRENILWALEETSEAGACLDGVEFDNFFESNLDYRPDHLELSENPLAFSEAGLRPARHSADGMWKLLRSLRHELDEHSAQDGCHARGISGNLWAPTTSMLVGAWVDFFVGEVGIYPCAGCSVNHQGMWREDMLLYRRATAYHKFFGVHAKQTSGSTLDPDLAEHESILRGFIENGLLYATEVALSELTFAEDEYREYHDVAVEYRPHVRRLQAAGWEPVTRAGASEASVLVERYGSAESGEVHFVYFNRSSSETTATLTIDADALGVASLDEVTDPLGNLHQDWSVEVRGDEIIVEDSLPADRGRMLTLEVERGRR